jgi:arylsulfatase A-like enzyme
MLYSCSSDEGSSVKTAEAKPNVIIILVDALRADHLGCYGYHRETSPALDQISDAAVTFSQAMSPSSWTKPSIPSLFTSLYPSRHGVFDGSSKDTKGHITSDILQDSLLTMAEVFQRNDYATCAFIHNAHLKGFLGFSQGFDVYHDKAGSAEEIHREFLSWLKEEPKKPFFAYLHYLDVHWPYRPPEPYDKIFGEFTSEIDFYTEEWRALREKINDPGMELTESDIEKMISLYDGELRYLDDNLEKLFEELKKENHYSNTLFVITADHGEEFLEHGMIGHGQSLYDELLRIPLIMKFPDGKWEGVRVESPAELVDILPTLIDYFSWQPLQFSDGRSLLKGIAGEEKDESNYYTYSELLHGGKYKRAIMKDGYKLIESYTGKFRRDPSQTFLHNIHIGDRVEIKGNPGDNHFFIADKISLDDNQDDDDEEIEGILSSTGGDGDLMILDFKVVPLPGVDVRGQNGELMDYTDLREGMRVKVNGHMFDGDRIEVNRVKVKKSEKRQYSLEGIIDDLEDTGKDSTIVFIAGYRILIDDETEKDGDSNTWDDVEGSVSLTAIELYDMANDPLETINLSSTHDDITSELQLLMNQDVPSIANMTEIKPREVFELDSETVEELKAIGYVD